MLVGVISDTHDNLEAVRKACRFFRSRDIGIVLHLGDIVAPFTLRIFKEEGIEKLVAVYGNNCGEKIGLLEASSKLGYEIHYWPHQLEINGRRIIMLHGAGSAEETIAVAEALALSGRYDVVLYGHTHKVDVRRINKALVLNPGEACGCLTGRRTAAIVDLEELKAEIVEL